MTSLCYKIVFGIVSISKHDVFRLPALETIRTNEGPSCICVPNLKRIYSSVREIMTGPKLNCEIGSRDLCLPTYGRICAPQVKTAQARCLCTRPKFEKCSFIRLRNIEGSQNFEIGHVAQATPT